MSEETNVPESDGTWSGLKKTIIGTLSTAVLAGGTWVTTTLFNGGEDKEETKTEQAAPAQPVINVNLENNNTNQQKQSGGTNTVIKERVVEKPVEKKEEKKSESEDAPW
jgi:flagellar basal body-associated protein FliL